jgi:hypothetical protein
MAVALVTPEYVEATTGADVSDTERVTFLIEEASALVMEWLGRTFDSTTAPTAVKQAVAILVAGALNGSSPSSPEEVKAEQIGDYRVEYAGAGRYTSGLDIRRVEYLLEPYRAQARAVRADVALDGVAEGAISIGTLDAQVVVNR